jgi:uncharacterized membrane protein
MTASRFILLLLLYSLFVYGIFNLLLGYLTQKAIFAHYQYIQVFIAATILVVYTILERALKRSDQSFLRFFMALSGLKLFLFLIVMLVFALLDRPNAFSFILNFLLLYFLYSAFEVCSYYRSFRKILKKN